MPTRRKRKQVEGSPLHYSAAASLRYKRELLGLIAPMLAAYKRELTETVQEVKPITEDVSPTELMRATLLRLRKRFQNMFAREAPEIAKGFTGQIDKASAVAVTASLKSAGAKITLRAAAMPKAVSKALVAATVDNVALIKSIATRYHEQIEQAVIKSVAPGGQGLKTVNNALKEFEGVTKRRAEFIARDQTSKVMSALNTERAVRSGATKFKWLHSGGGAEPRKLHQRLSGKVFEYAKPPVIDERTNARGMPGTLPRCRCVAIPILSFDEDDDE